MFPRSKFLPVTVFAACIACGDDGQTSDDEFGETGGTTEPTEPGPTGPQCEQNWHSLDGPPVDSSSDLPELNPAGRLPSFERRLELSGPPPKVAVDVGASKPPEPKNSPEPLEWEDFILRFATPTEGGWFVEGDLFRTSDQLFQDYLAYVTQAGLPKGATPQTLLGNTSAGTDDVWSGPRKISLTWCVGWIRPAPTTPANAELHAERYEQMVRAVEESARAWERVTNVNFVHLRDLDDPTTTGPLSGGCQPGVDGVYFRVRMDVANGCEGACKGKTNTNPSTELEPEWSSPENPGAQDRDLILSGSALATNKESQITARHELGHVLGFEHEHYREEFESCPNAMTQWRDLTPADPESVMIYDSCKGAAPNQPRLSAYDRLGAFFQYNWSRRQSQILGAASQIDELSYDGSGRAGIAWHDAKNATLSFWTSVAAPGEQLSFAIKEQCIDGTAPPCNVSELWSHRVQPSPLFGLGTAADLDVLLYGPGDQLSDLFLTNDGMTTEGQTLALATHTVLVVGAFANGIRDQVLFYGPGAEPDAIWDPQTGDIIPVEYGDFAYPLPGRYRGFGGGASDIIWYQPEAGTIEVWQWQDLGSPFEFLRQGPADASLLGLEAGGDYVPLIGDFDGDSQTDIFWYAPGETNDSLWLSASNQDVVIFDLYPHQVLGQYRSFVGDFNGDGIHDILWYSVADELEGGLSGIWYFDTEGGHSVRTFSVRNDYTPIVADFDDDGCTDVLWYDATSGDTQSLIWRCMPAESDFACDPPLTTPPQVFPIGYGGSF